MLDERVRAVLGRLERETGDEPVDLPYAQRSLQIPAESGALLYAICAGRNGCEVLELGGSYGYSTIWLAAAVADFGGHVTSLELSREKAEGAAANVAEAGLEEWVDVISGDAFDSLESLDGPYDVVFLDAWKELYEDLFARARKRVDVGGVIVADNITSHASELAGYVAARRADPGLVTVTVPIGNGFEVTTVLTGGLLSV
jgi:predicted O-methyltransferase YrrM